jgi:hypothetical protein
MLTTQEYNTSKQAHAAAGAPGMGPLAGGQHRWKSSAPQSAAPDTLPVSDTRPKALPAPVKAEHVAVSMAAPATTVPPTAAALSALAQQHDTQAATTAGFIPPAAQSVQAPAAATAAPAPSAGSHHHQRGVSSASVYDTEDLDTEWKTLLDNVSKATTAWVCLGPPCIAYCCQSAAQSSRCCTTSLQYCYKGHPDD